MTVVPSNAGAMLLICDQCSGKEAAGETSHDNDLVWPVVSNLGWTGSPFATGPHRCPPCSLEAPASPPVREARPPGTYYDMRTREDLDLAVITPRTDLDADLTERLRDDVMRAAAVHQHVLMDLRAVGLIDSTGLGLLVRARQEARQHEGAFDLLAPSRFLLTVLHTMRLDGVFRTFADLETALHAIRGQTAATAGDPGN